MAITLLPLSLPIQHTPKVRRGLRDIWNAHMLEGATFGKYDIPLCPTTATEVPFSIITWDEAKTVYNRRCADKDYDFKQNAFVCFYIDDSKFDGTRGIWHEYEYTLKVLRHFDGVITPDFSTYQDFPAALKVYQTYRMRLFGYWLGKNGIAVINNVRWGSQETYSYCFRGIPKHSIVSIGTVGGNPRRLIDRDRFEKGLFKMVEVLKPTTVIVYGSANYDCFRKLISQGILVVSFPSKTAVAFEQRKQYEQE